MVIRRLLLLAAVASGLVVPSLTAVDVAAAKRVTSPRAAAALAAKKKRQKTKVCKTGKKGRRCNYVAVLSGHNASTASLRTEPLDKPSGEIWLTSPNVVEEIRVNIYRPDGSLDEAALATLDEVFRCKRTQEVRAVDPRLYEHLSRIYDHFGKRRIELVSGFRFAERNSSRHFHASAMDIRITGVSIREMYGFAETLDTGGMGVGIYPSSGFVHIDYRAPGEPSYRWTDYSGPEGGKRKRPGRTVRAKKPTS